MATTTTPNLSLTLAVPGTNEPFDVPDVNANFTAIDTEVGSLRATNTTQNNRLTNIEDLTLPTATTPNIGVVPSGTTAERDGFWGSPSDAATRVALANKYARWFNTDKGWEEQYFAKFDDAGVATATPVKDNFGWGPSLGTGRVLISRFTLAKVGTPGTVTKKGAKVEFDTAEGFTVDGCFTSDFDRYELELTSTGGSTTSVLNMQFRAAGVTDSTSNYSYSFREIVPGTAESAIGPTTQMEISRAFVSGFILKSTVANPTNAARKTQMLNHMFDTDTKTRIGGSQLNLNKAVDGFYLDFSGTATFTGDLRIYGVTS